MCSKEMFVETVIEIIVINFVLYNMNTHTYV